MKRVKAETPEQQELLDQIADTLLDDDWVDVDTYEWSATPDGRPVLFLNDGFTISTLLGGTLAGVLQMGPTVNMVSFKDGRMRLHAPTRLGNPGDN